MQYFRFKNRAELVSIAILFFYCIFFLSTLVYFFASDKFYKVLFSFHCYLVLSALLTPIILILLIFSLFV